jgi:hypothetical protein
VQRPQLLHDQEQKDHDRPAGIQEILPEVPEAHAAQRSEVAVSYQPSAFSFAMTVIWRMQGVRSK